MKNSIKYNLFFFPILQIARFFIFFEFYVMYKLNSYSFFRNYFTKARLSHKHFKLNMIEDLVKSSDLTYKKFQRKERYQLRLLRYILVII